MSDLLVSTGEAARRLGITVNAVGMLIRHGALPASKTWGGHYRIRLSALQEMEQAQGIKPASHEADALAMYGDLVASLRALVVELQDSSSREVTKARDLLARADAIERGKQ